MGEPLIMANQAKFLHFVVSVVLFISRSVTVYSLPAQESSVVVYYCVHFCIVVHYFNIMQTAQQIH